MINWQILQRNTRKINEPQEFVVLKFSWNPLGLRIHSSNDEICSLKVWTIERTNQSAISLNKWNWRFVCGKNKLCKLSFIWWVSLKFNCFTIFSIVVLFYFIFNRKMGSGRSARLPPTPTHASSIRIIEASTGFSTDSTAASTTHNKSIAQSQSAFDGITDQERQYILSVLQRNNDLQQRDASRLMWVTIENPFNFKLILIIFLENEMVLFRFVFCSCFVGSCNYFEW